MIRKISISFVLLLAASLLMTGLALADSVRLGTVRADKVNVREGASTDSEVLGTLDADDSVTIVGSKGKFFKIKWKGTTGYVSDEFVSVQSSKQGTVNAKNVVLRKKASSDSDKLGTLKKGDKVSVYGERDGFYRVACDEGNGYVSKDYVDMGSSKQTSSKTEAPAEKEAAAKEELAKEEVAEASKEAENYVREVESGEYSEEELYLVAQLIYSEHRNATSEGYDAMASVVYNRLNSKRFPNSIEEVVFQENQFTVVNDREAFLERKPNSGSKTAVQKIFVDGIVTLPAEVMYFKSARLSKKWGSRSYYATIDGHMYYS